ncbi:polysaccharide deacetylase family protein [bacterium]|nr:polysaccharide deacetylase family protein [bacterium]
MRILLVLWFMTRVALAREPAIWDQFVAPRSQAEANRVSGQLNQLYLAEVQRLARPQWWAKEVAQRCRQNLQEISSQGLAPPPDARRFVQEYAAEQQRLALLYPRCTSEIRLQTGETAGWDLPERSFRLTFDDGPKPANTGRVLALLRANRKPAIFFVLGKRLQEAAGALPDYQGFLLGNHSFDHSNLPTLNPQQLAKQLSQTEAAAAQAGLVLTRLWRAPYGARAARELKAAENLGLHSVLWNVDSQDWQPFMQSQPGRIARRTLALMLLHRRGIVLMHDIHSQTPAELALLLNYLQPLNFTIVP